MKINRLVFFLGVFVVLFVKNSLAQNVDTYSISPVISSECGWCGTGCGLISSGKACPMIAPPEGKSCVKQNGVCAIVPTDKTCQGDAECAVNEYCYQPPMPPCPTGVVCRMMMPPKVCRPKTDGVAGLGQTCGGIRGIRCSTGLVCDYQKNTVGDRVLTDTTGVCVTGVDNKCGWCGLTCGLVRSGMACPMMAPPAGKVCIYEGNSCSIRTVPAPTSGLDCVPVPACVDGIKGSDGGLVYCDLKPGVNYCPRTNPTGVGRILGDADNNGKVNLADFGIWKRDYLAFSNDYPGENISTDFNEDNKIDLADFGIWKNAYLKMLTVTGAELPQGCKWVDVQCVRAPCPRQILCPVTSGT